MYDDNSELPTQQLEEKKTVPRPTTKELAHRTLKIAEEEIDKISKFDEYYNELEFNLHKENLKLQKRIYGAIVLFLFIVSLFFTLQKLSCSFGFYLQYYM